MAYKNIHKLTARRQGEVIGQIFRLITCYNDFFVPRPRVYIKEISKENNSIYWLQNSKTDEVSAVAIMDTKHVLECINLKFYILGHTITKVGNQMNNIMDHILGDYQDSNIIYFSKAIFGEAIGAFEKYNFIPFDCQEIESNFPSLGQLTTEYFGIGTGEKIIDAMKRKGYTAYIKFSEETYEKITSDYKEIFNYIVNKTQELKSAEMENEKQLG